MTPIPCPCCRAANDAGPACRRCKADLAPLFAAADRRAFLLADARRLVADGRPRNALARLDELDTLRPGADSQRVRAAAHLLLGDFSAALAAHAAAG